MTVRASLKCQSLKFADPNHGAANTKTRLTHVLKGHQIPRLSANIYKIQTLSRPDPSLVISGSLGELIVKRGRLPEDLALHYLSQVLTALEYLVKKKMGHLDIKGEIHNIMSVFSLY